MASCSFSKSEEDQLDVVLKSAGLEHLKEKCVQEKVGSISFMLS